MRPVIAILIGFLPNPRIYKRIALEMELADVHLICWDRGNDMLAEPDGCGYVSHVFHVNAGADPVRRYIPYRKFFALSMGALKKIQPDIIHVQGLDMLKIAQCYKKFSNKKVSTVYEVADLHRLLMDKQKGIIRKLAQCYLRKEERRLSHAYDLLVLTSEKYYDVYFEKFVSKEKTLYMPNVPDLSAFDTYKKKTAKEPLTVGYIGAIRYKKQILNLIEAAKEANVCLLIAGYENAPTVIESLCKEASNITWIGRFDFNSQAAALYGACDVIYSVYDADMHNVRVALPNKLYEAVYCELPIIVAKNTYLAELVEQWSVGFTVDHREPYELTELFKRLQDGTVPLDEIQENCRCCKSKVELAPYNEALMERIMLLLQQ